MILLIDNDIFTVNGEYTEVNLPFSLQDKQLFSYNHYMEKTRFTSYIKDVYYIAICNNIALCYFLFVKWH